MTMMVGLEKTATVIISTASKKSRVGVNGLSMQPSDLGLAVSEREARGLVSVEEMLPTLLVCGRASVAGGGECRLPLRTSDVRGRRSVVVRITVVDTSDG